MVVEPGEEPQPKDQALLAVEPLGQLLQPVKCQGALELGTRVMRRFLTWSRNPDMPFRATALIDGRADGDPHDPGAEGRCAPPAR
jgi:hypothetical protein